MKARGSRASASGRSSSKRCSSERYRDIVQPDGIPAIVPKDLFDRVQERMAENKKAPAKHKAEDEYLLTTKLFCGKCHCYMAGESGTGRNGTHRYYKCVSVKHHRGCDKKSVRKEWIENLAIELTRKVIFDDELIELIAKRALDVLNAENSVLPLLHKQYADTQKAIDNLIRAIEQGILTPSTKDRLEALEQEKSRLSVQIMREEMARPTLTQDQVLFWFHRLRKLDIKKLEHRRRLIDTFINAIYLYEDHLEFVFNYQEGTKTITFAELESADLGSDFTSLGAPRRSKLRTAQKRQSLLAAAVSSTVLRCSSSSPREPLCRARAGSPFSRADSWHFFAQSFQTRQVRTQGQSVKASGLSGFLSYRACVKSPGRSARFSERFVKQMQTCKK